MGVSRERRRRADGRGGDGPVDQTVQGVLFYLYAADLQGLRNRLLANGIQPAEIVDGTPSPRNEMRLLDPDGYTLMIAQIDDESTGGRFADR